MFVDLAAMGVVTATLFTLMGTGVVSFGAGIMSLVLAPIVLGFGAAKGGLFGRLMRGLFVVVVLPVFALIDFFELVGETYGGLAGPLWGLITILSLLLAIYMILGGRGFESLKEFFFTTPLLAVIVGLGAAAGLSAEAVATFLLAVVLLRLLGQSTFLRRIGGQGVARTSKATWDLGAAGVSLLVMAYFALGAVDGPGTLLAPALVVVGLEFILYFIFRRQGATAR